MSLFPFYNKLMDEPNYDIKDGEVVSTDEISISEILNKQEMLHDDNYVRLKSICGIILVIVLILVILDIVSDKSRIIHLQKI